jgi:hypothetical protein
VEPFRDRNFRLLFSGRALSYVGTYLAPIAVAFAVLDLGGSATEVGLSFAAWTIAQVTMLAGFAFSCGTVVWDTAMQRTIAPEKLARVAAYSWMGAMVFLPAGYALAGPIASVVGMRAYLLFGASWLVASTLAVVRVRSVREFTLGEPDAEPATAPA